MSNLGRLRAKGLGAPFRGLCSEKGARIFLLRKSRVTH
jgi:hypothetical protein